MKHPRITCSMINHCVFDLRYVLARDQVLTTSNIMSGFRASGIDPELTASQWIDAYGERHKIKMTSSSYDLLAERRSEAEIAIRNSRLDSLDLAIWKPKRREYKLPMPSLHKKHRKPPKTNIIGERLGAPKILTLPDRLKKLSKVENVIK